MHSFFQWHTFSPCGQTQSLPKKHTTTVRGNLMQRLTLITPASPWQCTRTDPAVTKLKICMCLKLKFIYDKELACEKQFINSLSCSHYALFHYHPQCWYSYWDRQEKPREEKRFQSVAWHISKGPLLWSSNNTVHY